MQLQFRKFSELLSYAATVFPELIRHKYSFCGRVIEQEMVDEGDAIKLETSGNQEEIVPDPDVSLKKRKIG